MTKRKRTFYTCDLCGREREGEEVSERHTIDGEEIIKYKDGRELPEGWKNLGHDRHVCRVCAFELRKKEDA